MLKTFCDSCGVEISHMIRPRDVNVPVKQGGVVKLTIGTGGVDICRTCSVRAFAATLDAATLAGLMKAKLDKTTVNAAADDPTPASISALPSPVQATKNVSREPMLVMIDCGRQAGLSHVGDPIGYYTAVWQAMYDAA